MKKPFSDRAQCALEMSDQEARNMRHRFLCSQHILLGLVREETGFAYLALEELGFDLNIARRAVLSFVCVGDREVTVKDIPRSECFVQVLTTAAKVSDSMKHTHIGTEHLFLGILKNPGCIAARALVSLGPTLKEYEMAMIGKLVSSLPRDFLFPWDE